MPNTEVFITARFTEMEKFKTTWLNYDGTGLFLSQMCIYTACWKRILPLEDLDHRL